VAGPGWRFTTAGPDNYLTSLWAAKEALAKALGDALCYEPSRLGSPQHWPRGRPGPGGRSSCPPLRARGVVVLVVEQPAPYRCRASSPFGAGPIVSFAYPGPGTDANGDAVRILFIEDEDALGRRCARASGPTATM